MFFHEETPVYVPRIRQDFQRVEQVQVKMPDHKMDILGEQLLREKTQMCSFQHRPPCKLPIVV